MSDSTRVVIRSAVVVAAAWFCAGSAAAQQDFTNLEPGSVAFASAAEAANTSAEAAFRRSFLFPGAGHFLTGDRTRGAVFLGVAAGSLIAGALLSGSSDSEYSENCDYDYERHVCRGSKDWTPFYVGSGVAVLSWVAGIADSKASAARMGAHRLGSIRAPGLEAQAGLIPVGGETRVGLNLRVAW
jgi:hypothetical protein